MAPNGGDDSVSSSGLGKDGRLTLLDVKPTETASREEAAPPNRWHIAFEGNGLRSQFARSNHARLMSVDAQGRLTANGRLLLVGATFDHLPVLIGANPDGSPVRWIRGRTPH